MTIWLVEVANVDSGEYRTVTVEAPSQEDATLAALVKAFHEYGWRHTRPLSLPVPAEVLESPHAD